MSEIFLRATFVFILLSALAGCAVDEQYARMQAQLEALKNVKNLPDSSDEQSHKEKARNLAPDEAVNYWQGVFETNDKDRQAAVELAHLYRRLGQYHEAVAVTTKALEYRPRDPQLLYEHGTSYIGAGYAQEAIEALNYALYGSPQDWRILSALGAAYSQLGEGAAARGFFEQALAQNPGEPSILNNLGFLLISEGEPARAEKLLRQALSSENPPPVARQYLAASLAMQGDFEQAQRIALAYEDFSMIDATLQAIETIRKNSTPSEMDSDLVPGAFSGGDAQVIARNESAMQQASNIQAPQLSPLSASLPALRLRSYDGGEKAGLVQRNEATGGTPAKVEGESHAFPEKAVAFGRSSTVK